MSKHIDTICFNAYQLLDNVSVKNPLIRYDFLITIGKKIKESAQKLIEIAHQETHLPPEALSKEIDRTILQINTYTKFALSDDFFHSQNNPSLKLGYVPLGVVVVFGASNFPFAYSACGGDVISALAVGCPVIFKGHENHPETWQAVCDIIKISADETNMPKHFFQSVGFISYDDSEQLVQNTFISAVAFTGSTSVGRHLFNLCNARQMPIPFFGELGSNNPVFICPHFFNEYYIKIANDFFNALTFRHGQICVKPSIICIPKTEQTESFIEILKEKIHLSDYSRMISDKIMLSYVKECHVLNNQYQSLGKKEISQDNAVNPTAYKISYNEWLNNPHLRQEIFGPTGIIITYENQEQILDIAHSFHGQLTTSFFFNDKDQRLTDKLTVIFQKKSGRLVYNQFPHSVVVDYNMTHGGVYPATTNSQMTAVGHKALYRFIRPITYQNLSSNLHSRDYSLQHCFSFFDTSQELCSDLAQKIAKKLSDAVITKGYATLAVSGGRLASEIFTQLSYQKISWEYITIILVDERCVSPSSSENNATLVENYLIKNLASKASFKTLYDAHSDTDALLNIINQDTLYCNLIDCMILGMGEDGHFASLFPKSKNLFKGLSSDNPYSIQYAPQEPIIRISMNMKKIMQSNSVFLAISGGEKINLLKKSLSFDDRYPISFLLEKKKINIFIS